MKYQTEMPIVASAPIAVERMVPFNANLAFLGDSVLFVKYKINPTIGIKKPIIKNRGLDLSFLVGVRNNVLQCGQINTSESGNILPQYWHLTGKISII